MENSNIKRGGVGANPTNEPTHPMTQYAGDNYNRSQYNRPVQQPEDVKIFPSDEQPSDSTVLGMSDAPSGWMGIIRKFASKLSDSKYGYWLPLLFLNRTNVVEGIADVVRFARNIRQHL